MSHHTLVACSKIGMRVKIACSSLIYRKMLRLDKISVDDTDVGKLVNLLSNDVERFSMAAGTLHYIWIMPIQAAIGTYVMYSYVGVAAFAGIAVMIIQSVPIQGSLSRMQGKLRFSIALRTDSRVKLMNEITSGIQVIKMYAWEKPFDKIVGQLRKSEMKMITKSSYIKGVAAATMLVTQRIILFVIILVYVLLGNTLTGKVVFPIIQLIDTLRQYVCIMFPIALASYAENKSSVLRIEEFLTKSERQNDQNELYITAQPGLVKLNQVCARWTESSISETLSDVSFELKPGSLCCVIGNVGSGKSSLLHLLLKEMALRSGKIEVGGIVSYASQDPWLFVSNVRNNILFGQPYHKDKYDRVVEVCALKRDFELFPFGDRTLVGERGVSLSGGQRARINLARAIYRDADVYLLDDPLSAVDPHVAKHLFEKCIVENLQNKTRILVTHQTQFLSKADFILVLDNGKVENFIKPSDISKIKVNLIRQASSAETPSVDAIAEKRSSVSSDQLTRSLKDTDEESLDAPEETEELIEKGSLSFSVYASYYRAGASTLVIVMEILLLIVAQAACNACELWLTFWTNNVELHNKQDIRNLASVSNLLRSNNNTTMSSGSLPDNLMEVSTAIYNPSTSTIESMGITTESSSFFEVLRNTIVPNRVLDLTENLYIQTYTLILLVAIILTIIRSLLFFRICMKASTNLHNTMFTNILEATMRFFDTNPSGRILNRFSKDMGAIDEVLPNSTLMTIQVFLISFGVLGITFIKSYWMIPPTIILGVILMWFRKIFMKSAQNVKRLEGVAKAPVFSYVAASLDGLSTIRASKAENMVKIEFDDIQDQHTATSYLFMISFEAFGLYLDMVTITFLVIAMLQFLFNDDALGGDAGLVISQSLLIIGMLQYGIRFTAEVAGQMTNVERVLQYTKLDKEGPFLTLPANKPSADWPEFGHITFKNVYLRYVADEDPVLKNLNLEIKPTEKIGIVGRTGAGKSSFISALFRLAPMDGTITIDGVDISKLGLTKLRSKISIIPQRPTLFSESVRNNLDPFGKCKDEVLWTALENVELKGAIESLDMKVSEGGSNFSVGQRQLLCLARALVRNNRILVMDEATANVDPQTDALIQRTIRKNFEDCTVITVAHRLNTIMDSDKVIVMDAGQIQEFDSPHNLLQDHNGFFSKMLSETGPAMEKKLRNVAEKRHKLKEKLSE
ncbi:hypothetical protein HHI36_006444 [Cryptolaemus montrouzieri]